VRYKLVHSYSTLIQYTYTVHAYTIHNTPYTNTTHYTHTLRIHSYTSYSGAGVAIPDILQEYRVKALKGIGGNGWRTAHNCPTEV
jgi:hypothetical protein